MSCIVCGKKLSSRALARVSMYCSPKCQKDWCTKIHFIDIDWDAPTWSNNPRLFAGTALQFYHPPTQTLQHLV